MIAAVDTRALLELLWAAPLAVAVVTISWGLVVNGVARAADARRDGRGGAATAFGALAIGGGAVFAVAIVVGLVVMLSKG